MEIGRATGPTLKILADFRKVLKGQVIGTLRCLSGRPEQLLHSLMQKARKAESPRVDRLTTFINYGMVVQQLCDNLVASGLVDPSHAHHRVGGKTASQY